MAIVNWLGKESSQCRGVLGIYNRQDVVCYKTGAVECCEYNRMHHVLK